MITTLKIKLGTSWSADIEFDEYSTLIEIHGAIQRAVDFENDHLYAFFTARTERARDRTMFDDENERIYDTRLCDIFPLPPKIKLFYLFDFGDYWIFRVARSRKKPYAAADGIKYPRVVKESGEKPIQYETYDGDV